MSAVGVAYFGVGISPWMESYRGIIGTASALSEW
jgi:hypothetical protein